MIDLIAAQQYLKNRTAKQITLTELSLALTIKWTSLTFFITWLLKSLPNYSVRITKDLLQLTVLYKALKLSI